MKSMQFMLVAAITFGAIAHTRAANLLEFTFTGTYTRTFGTPHTVGSSFSTVVLFDPTQADLNPSPAFGKYLYTSWIAPGPELAPYVFDNGTAANSGITIGSNEIETTWSLTYFASPPFGWTMFVSFPPGAFSPNSLPLTLDMTTLTSSGFRGNDTGVDLSGTLHSLSIREVPEPSMLTTLVVAAALVWRPRFGT